MMMHAQAVFAELLGACRNNGMSLPPSNLINPAYGLPEQLVVYSDPRNQYVGQTLEQAYEAAVSYFKKVPDILFVILPERGELSLCIPCATRIQQCTADRLTRSTFLP